MRYAAAFLLALLVSLPAARAQEDLTPVADRAESLAILASYAGDWTGRGESRDDFDAVMERTRCNLTAVFDEAAASLSNDGFCSVSGGRAEINGAIALSGADALTGGYFIRYDEAELLDSDGQIFREGLIVTADYRVTIRDEVRDISVRISVGTPMLRNDGVMAFRMLFEVLNPDTGDYVLFSDVTFTPVD